MRIEKILQRCPAVTVASAACAIGISAQSSGAQLKTKTEPACCTAKKQSAASRKAAAKFGTRAEALLGAMPASKGQWGLLIMDAESGDTLYEQNADRYFVPASNMKLFTTALALAKLGPEYRFHTTLETRGTISSEGVLGGDLTLVGRGDPNLSNRKFPYELKEEFDGPPERGLVELADALVAKGVKEISGDVIGDDSYFPRERYPNGWEIDDMLWEYGAAISAIVVDDNTVALTLTPGEHAGNPVQAAVTPATPDFMVENEVTTSAGDVKSDLTLTREPGSNLVVVKGTLPAKSAPRKLVLAIEEPAQHAAATLKRLLEERGGKVAGVDGTLEDRMKNTPAAGRIHAKTGSIEHVRTLSGFAETPSGRRVIFSFLSNNQGGKSHEAADALTGLCVAMLEEFNVTPPKRGLEHQHPQ